ncbi:hypothetical protein [Streptomyces sp. Rer75]|uniref:hypothetical protein n=1 Tax=Streptomyces sp. Rer75 TaxID=2750011 RepID=UPI0015CFA0FD|nr:hypothetical protein [Streptomyces sp. Rer75]QLH21722.1 hypothetical protein HYQ63_14720 [Streptomyces sp. Rer75]
MNRTVPTFRPSKETVAAGVFWFSLLAAVRENVLVNGILLHAAADLACWRSRHVEGALLSFVPFLRVSP